jgi:hypothetical protein
MTRRIWSAALALTLAGGVYLAGAPAQASNMGFKLERDFDFKRTSATGGRALINIYYVGLPYFNGMGDVANTNDPAANKCVGDPGTSPAVGDGIINSDDAICEFWPARATRATTPPGSFAFSYFDTNTCSIVTRLARIVLGNVQFSLTPFPATGDLNTAIGYQINVGVSPGTNPDQRNRAVIVGSHDPSFTGRTIAYTPTCGTGGPPCCNAATAARIDLIAVPYHSMYQMSVELLCGLRGVDWPDTNNDWIPDDRLCDGGISDQSHTIAVTTVKNDDPATGGTSGYVSQSARYVLGNLTLTPVTPFALIPGEAYQVNIPAGHVTTTFLSPHF